MNVHKQGAIGDDADLFGHVKASYVMAIMCYSFNCYCITYR